MVGRLVEQQEVGVAQQQFSQLHAHLPSTAEHCHRAAEVAVLEAQAQQHLLSLLLPACTAEEGEVFRHLVVPFQQACVFSALIVGAFGNLRRQAFLLALQVVDDAESRHGFLEHRADTVGHHLLRQVAHRLAGSHDEGAAFGFLPTTEYLEQRRLAGTVHADESNAVVVADIEDDVVEEVGAGELNRQVVYTNQSLMVCKSKRQRG